MRPAPHEIIAAVRDLLREIIAPDVASNEGKVVLRRIMAVLRDVRWDDLTLAMARENRELAAMAKAAGNWISADPGRGKGWNALLSEIVAAVGDTDCLDSFEGLQTANLRLCMALAQFVEMASAGGEAQGVDGLEGLRRDFAGRLASLARARASARA